VGLLSAAFSKVNDIRSHVCGPVRGVPYVPRLSFEPFHVAISEGSHVVGISSKATDGEDICLQTLFMFLFFLHTPRFPDSSYPVPEPWPRVFHLAETAMILPAALHKFLVRKRTFVTLFGAYELIKLVSSGKSKVKSQNPRFLLHGQ